MNKFDVFIITPVGDGLDEYKGLTSLMGVKNKDGGYSTDVFNAIIHKSDIPSMLTIKDSGEKPGEYRLNISVDSIITINGFGGTFKLTPDLAFRGPNGPGECYIVKTINDGQPQFSNKEITFCIIGGGDPFTHTLTHKRVYRVYILKSEYQPAELTTGSMPKLEVDIGADSAYYLAGLKVTVPSQHRFYETEYNDDLTLKGGGKKHKKNKSKKRRKNKSKKNKSKKRKRKTRRKRR